MVVQHKWALLKIIFVLMYILWCIELPKKSSEEKNSSNNADIDIPSLTHFALLDVNLTKNTLKCMHRVKTHTVATEP